MTRARRTAAALLALLPLLAAPFPARGADEDERARELEEVRRAIEERRRRVEAFERRERGLLETVEAMDHAAADLTSREARARQRARTARSELAALAGREGEIARRREGTRRAMSARAVALYKAGEEGPVRALFSAGSMQEMLARARALRVLLDHDRALLARFETETVELARTRVALKAAAAESDHTLVLAEAQAVELAGELQAKRAVLGEVRRDRARERAALQELEAAARALEETLARLRGEERAGRPREDLDFAGSEGRLPPPVDALITRGFGLVVDEELRTETFRKGVDFAAPAGESVRAVAAGEVRFAGWFRGYGRIAILDHGDGYFTVSGHLDRLDVEPGQEVEAGQALGTVGETGSLSGPRLYFEIRRGAEPLDPARWLRPAP